MRTMLLQDFPDYPLTKALQNALDVDLTFDFVYANPESLLHLFSPEAPLSTGTYYRKDHPSATPSSYGFWIKKVEDQCDLDDNYAVIIVGDLPFYLFFKQVDSVWTLTQASELSTGYESTDYVHLQGSTGYVTASNAYLVILKVEDSDGILILGVIDDGSDFQG